MKFAFVISKFNHSVTEGLVEGAKSYLKEKGLTPHADDFYYVPGAFEIPLIAQSLAKLEKYDGIICLGCVIQGDTAHFEFISLGATLGIMQGMLTTETPISFGVLTVYTDEQAQVRCQANSNNKGREAAVACYEAALTLDQIARLARGPS